eukprot:361866-Chlamydomonas_euryale.AAC.2
MPTLIIRRHPIVVPRLPRRPFFSLVPQPPPSAATANQSAPTCALPRPSHTAGDCASGVSAADSIPDPPSPSFPPLPRRRSPSRPSAAVSAFPARAALALRGDRVVRGRKR